MHEAGNFGDGRFGLALMRGDEVAGRVAECTGDLFLLRQRGVAVLLPLRFELAGHRAQGIGEAGLAGLFTGCPVALPVGLGGAHVGEQGGATLGEGVGETGLRFVEGLGQAVAGLFVLGQRTAPGIGHGLHGTVEALGNAVELVGNLLRQHRLLVMRGLGKGSVAGGQFAPERRVRAIHRVEQRLRALAEGVGKGAQGGLQLLVKGIAAAGVPGQRALPGVGNLADGLVEASGDTVELAGQRGGQLLLAGASGFGQSRMLLGGIGLQPGLGTLDRGEQGSRALLEAVGVGGERVLLLLVLGIGGCFVAAQGLRPGVTDAAHGFRELAGDAIELPFYGAEQLVVQAARFVGNARHWWR